MIMVTSMGTYPPLMATTNNHLGRNKLPWSQEIWNRIDQAVHDEMKRARVAMKFIPLYGPIPPGTLTIPADRVAPKSRPLGVIEKDVEEIIEIQVQFRMTVQQVEREEELRTAVTLATRAANQLAQGEDVIIFQGREGIESNPLFTSGTVEHKPESGLPRVGLLKAAEDRFEPVEPVTPPVGTRPRWSENTFRAVSAAYSLLQSGGDGSLNQAHYGPYALVLHHVPYADTYAPLEKTLIMPADRIKPLMTAGFHGTGTMPDSRGIVVSLGGNTMDLVCGVDATTAVLQEDPDGFFRFRVYERFALRVKDDTAVIRLEFQSPD
jgi:uncharacterized linocin/CFP29 family protein